MLIVPVLGRRSTEAKDAKAFMSLLGVGQSQLPAPQSSDSLEAIARLRRKATGACGVQLVRMSVSQIR